MKNSLAVCEFHSLTSDVSRMYFCAKFFSSVFLCWTSNKLNLSSLRRLFCIIYVGGLSQRRIDDRAIKNIVNILFCFHLILVWIINVNNTPTFQMFNDTTAQHIQLKLIYFSRGFFFFSLYIFFALLNTFTLMGAQSEKIIWPFAD